MQFPELLLIVGRIANIAWISLRQGVSHGAHAAALDGTSLVAGIYNAMP
jgi:hypothetical protein